MPVLTSRQVAADTWTTQDKQITGLTSVDTAKSILFFGGVRIDDVGNRPAHTLIRGRLSGATTIDYDRNDNNGSVEARVGRQLMEFSSGMLIKRGSTTMNSTTKNESIIAIDQSKTFIIITIKNAGSTFGNDDFVEADFTSDINMRLRVNSSSSSCIVDWQICEITDGLANIQSGSVSLSGTSATDSLTPNVDLSKTFLVFSYRASGNVFPEDGAVRGKINSTSQVGFDRRVSGGTTMEISWFTIEMTDGTIVKEYLHNMPAASSENNDTVTSVTTSRTTIVVPTQRWGKNQNSTTDEFGTASPLLELTTTSNVRFRRDAGINDSHDHSYYMVEWNDSPIVSNASRLINPGSHITSLTGGLLV